MMKVLLEFNLEDVIKVFNPFFSKPEVSNIFKELSRLSEERIESLRDYVQKILIDAANQKIKNLNDKPLTTFVQLPEHLAGAYAIKIVSLVKKHIETLLKNNEDLSSDPMPIYHIYRAGVISAAFAIVSYIKSKKIIYKLPPSMKQIIDSMEKSNSLESLRNIVEEDFFSNIQDILAAIHSYHIKMLYKPIYSDENWEVFHVKDHNQACVIGGNSNWCVSSSSGEEHMQRYIERKMNLYALLNKKDNNEKYLLAVPVFDETITRVIEMKKKLENDKISNADSIFSFLDKHIWNALENYLESPHFRSEIEILSTNAETVQKDLEEIRGNPLSKTFVEDFNNNVLASKLLIREKSRVLWHLIYELWLSDNPHLIKNDGVEFVANLIKTSFDRYFSYRFYNINFEDINKQISEIKSNIFPSFDMFVWKVSFLHNFEEYIGNIFPKLESSMNTEYKMRFTYELADIRNHRLSFSSFPDVEEVYRRALPEYQTYFDMLGFNFTNWLEGALEKAYENDIKLQNEIKSDFMNKNKNSRFEFIRNYLKYRNTNSKFLKYEQTYFETVNTYQNAMEILKDLYNINPAIKEIMGFLEKHKELTYLYTISNDYNVFDPIIGKDFLMSFEKTFTVNNNQIESLLKMHFIEDKTAFVIKAQKNVQGWIKMMANTKPCRIWILISIVVREILKKIEEFPKELLGELEEIIHEHLARI